MERKTTTLFDEMTSKGLMECKRAAEIEKKDFSNSEWRNAYLRFCEATDGKDIRPEKFETYVRYWGSFEGRKHYNRIEKDDNNKWYKFVQTRMMNPTDINHKSGGFNDIYSDIRKDFLGGV